MVEQVRDYAIYFVRCPDNPDHFILKDPADPIWEKTPPRSPETTHCPGCGEVRMVKVTQPWRIGLVSPEERDAGRAYAEPDPEHVAEVEA